MARGKVRKDYERRGIADQERLFTQRSCLLLASLVIVCLGFALRLGNLAGDSFWIDEILTIRSARNGVEAITSVRDHPPLFYVLALISIRIFGEGEFAARLPALFAGLLSLPLLIRLGKRWARHKAGLWAAFILALVPFHISLSQTARHYSLLVTISLATYLVLYRVLKRPRWSGWLLYGGLTVLNLYTHYGAFIVLAAQTLLIGGWLFFDLIRGPLRWEKLSMPVVTAIGVFLLYLPWLPRFQLALAENTGHGTITDTGSVTPLGQWVSNIFWTFNIDGALIGYILGTLFLSGIIFLFRQRRYLEVALLLSATAVSLLLIAVFQVARDPFVRYVSFMLPHYLFAAGIGLAGIMQMMAKKWVGATIHRLMAIGLAVGLVVVAWPGMKQEYDFILEDWRGILSHLDGVADTDAIVLGLSLNYRQGLNLVNASLPYYLDRSSSENIYLFGNDLDAKDLEPLREVENEVWAVVFDWNSPTSLLKAAPDLEITPFQTALFVVAQTDQTGSSLERLEALYDRLIPLVSEPEQRCLLYQDRAVVLMTARKWEKVAEAVAQLRGPCQEVVDDSRFQAIEQALLLEKLNMAVENGDTAEATSLAIRILAFDRKSSPALAVLTAEALADLVTQGLADIEDQDSPESVRLERFSMPQDGDWGDVLLLHPPASITFDLTLPDEPVTFHTRIAMAPESWGWGGDGATFILRIQFAGEATQELFRQHIYNTKPDQRWHAVNIPLAKYAGQHVRLTLVTENGPSGDGTGDWAGWETPRLMWSVPD